MCHDGRFGVHRKSHRSIVHRSAHTGPNSSTPTHCNWTGLGKNQIRLPYYSAVNYKQDGGTRSAKTNGRTTTRSYQERERRKQREKEEEEWKKGETKNLRKTYVSHIHNLCCLVLLLFFLQPNFCILCMYLYILMMKIFPQRERRKQREDKEEE